MTLTSSFSSGGGQTSGCEPPVPRWSTRTMSWRSCTPLQMLLTAAVCSVAATPGPPARYAKASGRAGFRRAGTTTTRSPIRGPRPVSRFSGTSSVPHFAGTPCTTQARSGSLACDVVAAASRIASALASTASRRPRRSGPRRSPRAPPAPPPAGRREHGRANRRRSRARARGRTARTPGRRRARRRSRSSAPG